MNMQSLCEAAERLGYKPRVSSYAQAGTASFLIAEDQEQKRLLIAGEAPSGFQGKEEAFDNKQILCCPLTHENAGTIQRVFPWLQPISARRKEASFGTGDRLGLVTGAHIAAFNGTGVFPILAQQSKRELTLTGRTNRTMIEDVMWQVFENGYRGGYGADGDHLKTLEDITAALADGSSFITLDCSDHIPSRIRPTAQEFDTLEKSYCRQKFCAGGLQLHIPRDVLNTLVDEYWEAIEHIYTIYGHAITACGRDVSFEISLDETGIPTSLNAHFFVAEELRRRGVRIDSLAPRFCGEFQKGIDYIGDVEAFRENLRGHVEIAENFGYKISVHSGSDKFRILPCIGKECRGRFHLKTSGTSWVEAVRVIAMAEPELFRRMAGYSCQKFENARQYYHVTANVRNVPDMREVPDADLPALMDLPDMRQVMHITYGSLLGDCNAAGRPLFRDDIYRVLRKNKSLLGEVVSAHIRRHLQKISADAGKLFGEY